MTEEQLAKKCHWWWRQSFAQTSEQSHAAMAALLQSLQESEYGKALAAIAANDSDTSPEPILPSAPVPRNPPLSAQETMTALFEERWIYSAWLYEVGARVKGRPEFGKPWIELTLKQKQQLGERWPDPVQPPSEGYVRTSTTVLRPVPPPGWTTPCVMSWNLKLENASLARGFLEWVARMREHHGIPNPHPNKGKRRRQFSWREVELMDIQQHELRGLDESETSRVSKAKAEFLEAETVN